MLLSEIIAYKSEVPDIKKSGSTKNKYILDIESSKKDADYNRSASYIDVVVYPEEQRLFDTMLQQSSSLKQHPETGVIYHHMAPGSDSLSFSKYNPPKKILAVTSFSLYKGTGDTLHKLHSNRMMDVLKKRDPYNYISDVDYLDFIAASIEQLSTFTKTSKGIGQEPTKMSAALTKFNKDVFDSSGIAILEAPSSSSLVNDVANKLKETVPGSIIISDSLTKSIAPKSSDYQYKNYMDKDRANARKYVPQGHMPVGEFALRKFGSKSKDYNKFYKEEAKEQSTTDLSEKQYQDLMQRKLNDLVQFKNKLKDLHELHNIAVEIDPESVDQLNHEIHELQNDINDIENEFTRHGSNPNRSKLLQNVIEIRKYYKIVSRYVYLQEKQSNGKLNSTEEAELSKVENMLNKPGLKQKVAEMFNEISTMKFQIKTAQVSFYGRKGTDGPMAYGSYEIFKPNKKHNLDKLNGKVIVIVDDNIVNGTSVSDIVKTIFKAGVLPKAIYAFAPHTFKDISKEEHYQYQYNAKITDAQAAKIAMLDAQIEGLHKEIKQAHDVANNSGKNIDKDNGKSLVVSYDTLDDLKKQLIELEKESRTEISGILKSLSGVEAKAHPESRDIALIDEKIKFNINNIKTLMNQIETLKAKSESETDKTNLSTIKRNIKKLEDELSNAHEVQKEMNDDYIKEIKASVKRMQARNLNRSEIETELSKLKGLKSIDSIYATEKKRAEYEGKKPNIVDRIFPGKMGEKLKSLLR
jgi:hypothetical protein